MTSMTTGVSPGDRVERAEGPHKKGRKLEGDKRKEVESLFRDVTADYGDGKFPHANGKINKLFAILK